jgi:hypothetical protein
LTQSHGYAVISSPESTKEYDTITCAHCNSIVFLKKPGADAGGFCRQCMKGVCGKCADQGRCTPFERKLDAYERRMRFWDSLEGK